MLFLPILFVPLFTVTVSCYPDPFYAGVIKFSRVTIDKRSRVPEVRNNSSRKYKTIKWKRGKFLDNPRLKYKCCILMNIDSDFTVFPL